MSEFEQWLRDIAKQALQELGLACEILAIFGVPDHAVWCIKFNADTRDLCDSFHDEHGAKLSDEGLLQMIKNHLTVVLRESGHVLPPGAMEKKDRIRPIADEFYTTLQCGEDLTEIARKYERALRIYQHHVNRWTSGFIQPSADDVRLMDGAQAETNWAAREIELVVSSVGGLLIPDMTPESDDENETSGP